MNNDSRPIPEDIKLPKQWRHWCKLARLQTEGYKGEIRFGRCGWAYFSLRGRGRRFRVNMYGDLSVSVREPNFDRWALSWVADVPMPKTEKEFLAAIAELIKLSDAETRSRYE